MRIGKRMAFMTTDELIEIIGRCGSAWLIKTAESMAEKDRRKLSKTASQTRREIERNRWHQRRRER